MSFDIFVQDIPTAFAFHLYGGEEALFIIADILDELGARAFAPRSESGLFELDQTTKAFLRWREYRNKRTEGGNIYGGRWGGSGGSRNR